MVDPAHLVGTGGVLGALLRHFFSQRIGSESFPLGTVTVNVLGSFVLGLLTFSGSSHEVVLLVGTGACGSFTTFSSFAFETVRLEETGERTRALLNAAGTFLGASAAIGLAWVIVFRF